MTLNNYLRYHVAEILKLYIKTNVEGTEYAEIYPMEYLNTLSKENLINLANQINTEDKETNNFFIGWACALYISRCRGERNLEDLMPLSMAVEEICYLFDIDINRDTIIRKEENDISKYN